MMQMPLLSYPHFSQFLQLQQQQQLQQRYSRAFLSTAGQGKELGMLSSQRSGTSCSEASTGTPSPSPSPPLSITENFSTNPHHQSGSKTTAKSFTIDAILGIRDREMGKIDREQLGAIPGGFPPRLGLHLSSGSRLDIPSNYASSLDLSNGSLERRLSSASRDVLSFQLPTDLTTASEASNFGGDLGRRDFHQISTFSSANPCSRLSEKSPSDGGKKCGGKSKRVRTIFTPEQLERLEAEFERQQYMVGPERLYLAHTLQLTEAQVKVWFQNRRIKWRKQHLEIQQQRLAAMKQQNQRDEMENSDEESGDSASYSFTTETNDNGGGNTQTFFKSVENISELENAGSGQFRDELAAYHNENSSENQRKNEAAGTKTL